MTETIPDRWIEGHAERRIDQLRPGDRVDCEGDPIADPNYGDDGATSDHPEFRFEFEVVLSVVVETNDCSCVEFESGFTCGFPPDYWIEVDAEQVRKD